MTRKILRLLFSIIFTGYSLYSCWAVLYYDPRPNDIAIVKMHWQKVQLPMDSLQTGDLVLRHGKGLVSRIMKDFNTHDKRYSHSGIIHRDGKRLLVFNSIGGETREKNRMAMDLLERFVHPGVAFNFGIYRYDFSDEERMQLDSVLSHWYTDGLEFDHDFDMSTDAQMYCSEMIWKAIRIVKKSGDFLPLSQINGKPYVGIDDLYLNRHCRQILQHKYE